MSVIKQYDVVVIGAGVVGCATARELSMYDAETLVLEAGPDIACGATRANSGIVHTGYDPEPGTLKAAYNVRGAQMFPALQQQLRFSYRKNGALVVTFSQDDISALEQLRERAVLNGAPETFVIGEAELRELEPNVGPDAVAALHVPDSGIVDPYGFALACAENAADNGVEFAFNSPVVKVERVESAAIDADVCTETAAGAGADAIAGEVAAGYHITLADGRCVQAKAVVNAAGVFADEINNMVSKHKLRIAPRRGEYHLFKEGIHAIDHTMFPVPTALSKGVLVGTSSFGNQFVGPSSSAQDSKTDVATTADGLAEVLRQASRLWPGIMGSREWPQAAADGAANAAAPAAATGPCVISNFAGIRATNADTGDFVVGPVEDAPGFFNAACIDSPGLASSPALGQDLAQWAAGYVGAGLREDYNPERIPAPLLFMMPPEAVERLVEEEPSYGVKICGCANVMEGEVVAALHRPLPVTCLDALKWRTGVTMGECQGGRCQARLLEVMAREMGVRPTAVCKRGAGSELISGVRCACEVPLPEKSRQYEKPRSLYGIPGTRPAGLFSAYGAQGVMARTGYLPGQNVLVWGSLPAADTCAQWLEKAGAQVTRVRGGQVMRIEGEVRVSAVVIAGEDGQERRYDCDTLVMSDELILHVPVQGH